MNRPPNVLLIATACMAWMPACGPAIHPSFDSPEPAARNAAIVTAAGTKDPSAIPQLVRMLDSDDPATRLLAIRTLESITGETFGYDHADDRDAREPSVSRWQQYAQSRSTGGSTKEGSGRTSGGGAKSVPGIASSGAGDSADE
jgi:hypothetical protein